VANRDYPKTTPEERARRANQERLQRLIDRAVAELGTTREEFRRRHGLPPEPRYPRA